MAAAAAKIAREYHAAMKALESAERAHEAALEKLQAALDERRAHDVGRLRLVAGESEAALSRAHEAAIVAHRAYWRQRLADLEPHLLEAAVLMRRYSRVAFACGVVTHNPARAFLEDRQPAPEAVDVVADDDAVPLEHPVSELLREATGAWRDFRSR